MRIRYFIEYKRPDPNKWDIVPIGVWAHGVDDRSMFDMGYVAGYEAEEWDAQCVVNHIVEQCLMELPDDFLEQHRDSLPIYLGSRTAIVETDEFASINDLITDLLSKITKGRIQ